MRLTTSEFREYEVSLVYDLLCAYCVMLMDYLKNYSESYTH